MSITYRALQELQDGDGVDAVTVASSRARTSGIRLGGKGIVLGGSIVVTLIASGWLFFSAPDIGGKQQDSMLVADAVGIDATAATETQPVSSVVDVPKAAAPVVKAAVVKAPEPPAAVVKAAVVKAPEPPAAVVKAAVVKAPEPPAAVVKAAVVKAPESPAPVVKAAVVKAPEPPAVVVKAAVVKVPEPPAPVMDVPVVVPQNIKPTEVVAKQVKEPVMANSHEIQMKLAKAQQQERDARTRKGVELARQSLQESPTRLTPSHQKKPVAVTEKKKPPVMRSKAVSLSSSEVARLRAGLLRDLASGKLERAGKTLETLQTALGHDSPFIIRLQAYFQMKKGNHVLALDQYEALLATDANDNDSLLNAAIIEIQLQRYDEAFKRLQLLATRPGYGDKARRLSDRIRSITSVRGGAL